MLDSAQVLSTIMSVLVSKNSYGVKDNFIRFFCLVIGVLCLLSSIALVFSDRVFMDEDELEPVKVVVEEEVTVPVVEPEVLIVPVIEPQVEELQTEDDSEEVFEVFPFNLNDLFDTSSSIKSASTKKSMASIKSASTKKSIASIKSASSEKSLASIKSMATAGSGSIRSTLSTSTRFSNTGLTELHPEPTVDDTYTPPWSSGPIPTPPPPSPGPSSMRSKVIGKLSTSSLALRLTKSQRSNKSIERLVYNPITGEREWMVTEYEEDTKEVDRSLKGKKRKGVGLKRFVKKVFGRKGAIAE